MRGNQMFPRITPGAEGLLLLRAVSSLGLVLGFCARQPCQRGFPQVTLDFFSLRFLLMSGMFCASLSILLLSLSAQQRAKGP